MPLPSEGREAGAFLDLAHAPAFGVLTWAAWCGFRPRLPHWPLRRALAIWAAVVLVGAAIELLQGLTGRSPSWHDLLANGLGSGAALIGISTPRAASPRVRLSRLAAIVVLFAIPSVSPLLILTDSFIQLQERPRLASFEQPLELSRWEFDGCRATRSRNHATDGTWSLRLVMDRGTYPAATLAWPVRDWSAYTALEFDVYLESGPAVDLVLKIEDSAHDGRYADRFHRTVHLVPGPHRVRIPLSEVEEAPLGRKLDLARVRRLQVFAVHLPSTVTVYLDDVRLKR
jgi:hypothetical protein